MSAYGNDPRVYLKETGSYWIPLTTADLLRFDPELIGQDGSIDGYVTPMRDGRFEAYVGTPGAPSREFDTADDAIHSLIGDPA